MENNLIVSGKNLIGKTRGVIMPIVEDIINKDKSFVLIDLKKEYYNTYLDKLLEKGYEVRVINLDDSLRSDSYNPLKIPYDVYKEDKDKASEYLRNIYSELFKDEGGDPFWPNTSSDLAIGVTLKLFEKGKSDEINLLSVYNMICELADDNKLEKVIKYFEEDRSSLAYMYASTALSSPSETLKSIIVYTRDKLMPYTLTNLTKVLCHNNISFDEKFALFVIPSKFDLVNVIINVLIRQLFEISKQFDLILDNYDMLDNFDLVRYMQVCLDLNIRMIVGTRSLNKIKEKYGDYILNICDLVTDFDNLIFTSVSLDKELPKTTSENISVFKMLD